MSEDLRHHQPVARAFRRGWPVVRYDDDEWRWESTLETGVHQTHPACPHCGLEPGPDGHDPCLGHIDNVTSACCGHGVIPGHLIGSDRELRVTVRLPSCTPVDGPFGMSAAAQLPTTLAGRQGGSVVCGPDVDPARHLVERNRTGRSGRTL